MSRATQAEREVARYLRTGSEVDPFAAAWPGRDIMERGQACAQAMAEALIAEVRRRVPTPPREPAMLAGLDVVAYTRRKIEPMVRGLFGRVEQEAVLTLLEKSVSFVAPSSIERILREARLHAAWEVANLYLLGAGAPLLSKDAPRLLGMSEGAKCFVWMSYFDEENPHEDVVVHEIAHMFHNCKRGMAGLNQTRRREWLLDIEYRKRETFAYSCEAYARILELGRGRSQRLALAEEFAADFSSGDDRVDEKEVADIVREAVLRRNGWKVILARCAPPRRLPMSTGEAS